MINNFPFKIIDEIEGLYEITLEPQSIPIYVKYNDLFENNGYSSDGICWEGHILQILEKIYPELLKDIDFASDPAVFSAFTYKKEIQIKFVEILNPVFADSSKLEEYIKQADSSRIKGIAK